MSKIKEAYDALVEAIQEEAGVVPYIDITFHQHQQVKNPITTAIKLARKLEMESPEYNAADEYQWFASKDYARQLDLTIFM